MHTTEGDSMTTDQPDVRPGQVWRDRLHGSAYECVAGCGR